MQVVRFNGCGELIRDVATKAHLYLKKEDTIAVISLLDLYGLPADFYASEAYIATRPASERYDWGKRKIEKIVNQPQFRHFFAVHETEAWLLSDPSIFPREIKEALPKTMAQPEKINFDEPPAKLLNKIYLAKTGKKYKKRTGGRKLFEKLDPNIAYRQCPKLKEMLDEMLKLAQDAVN